MAMVTKEENPVTVAAAAAANVNLPQTLSPESAAAPVSHDREVNTNTTPIALEKPSEDGFNWRKYGQKNVKGNEYVRSYYKCSYPNCSVKKQIERSHDGRITDVTYLGSHEHAKPISEPKGVSVPLLRPHCPPSAAIANEDKTSDKFGADDVQPMNVETATVTVPDDPTPMPVTPINQRRDEHNESLTPKRRKKSADVTDITPEKPGQESRLVIQTVSEVDIVNDGYRWRKYGQKMVKGNPNPRSYYRCSTAGCPVKKHVERASYDPKVVITTYEGQHDHNLPPVRTILPQSPSAPSSGGGVEPNGAEKSKSEESDDARHHTVEEKDTPSITVEGDSEKLSSDDNSDRMTEETERVEVETKVVVSETEPKVAEAEADSDGLTKSEISKTEPKDVKTEIPKTDPKDGATDSVSLTKPEISTTKPTDMETEISTTPKPKDGATTDSGSLTKPEISKTEPTDMDTENVVTEISKTPEAKDVKTEISETDPKDNATDETDPNTVVEKTAEEPGKC